jgi:hypothetical protein
MVVHRPMVSGTDQHPKLTLLSRGEDRKLLIW